MSQENQISTQPSFSEWFCLADARKNFKTSPVPDKTFLLGEPEWENEIDAVLKRASLLSTPVRLAWWGQYGIGKTHRLRHTEHVVSSKGYKFRTVFVACTDIQDKTGFEKLHFDMINALGRDVMRELVSSYSLKLRTGVKLPSFEELAGNATDVANALRTFGGENQQLVQYAWQFLCGMNLRGEDVRLAGVTKSSLDSSHDYAAVTSALGTIIERETGRQLLYLIDEVENIQRITNKNSEALWKESIRLLLDTENVNIVMAIGAERVEGLPKIITFPDIVRRIQKDNIRQLPAFGTHEASAFLKQLLAVLIDADRRKALEASEGYVPPYDATLYPFADRTAFDQFCGHVTVDPRSAKPSEILEKLNNVAAEAFLKGRRLITEKQLQEMGLA